MPRRYIVDDLLFNADFNELSDCEQLLFFRMLLISDDFGFVPADQYQLLGLTNLTQHPIISKNFQEILGNITERHGALYEIERKAFFQFNPVSFDSIQKQVIYKRTQSKWLRCEKDKIQEILGKVKKFFPRARVKPQHNNKDSSLNSSRKKKEEKNTLSPVLAGGGSALNPGVGGGNPNPNGNGFHPNAVILDTAVPAAGVQNPDSDLRSATIPEEVIRILHRFGARSNIYQYQTKISELSWLPDLRKLGQRIGFACLLHQAERFEQYYLGHVETGKMKPNPKHNPRSKFFNWCARVRDHEKTTGDTETSWPEPVKNEPDQYAEALARREAARQ